MKPIEGRNMPEPRCREITGRLVFKLAREKSI